MLVNERSNGAAFNSSASEMDDLERAETEDRPLAVIVTKRRSA